MIASTIIERVMADGVMLALSPSETLKVSGDPAAVNRWLPTLRDHKPCIVAMLKAGDTATPMIEEPFDREAFDERAAIAEFDGGLTRDEAEARAWHEDDRRRCAHCLNLLPNGICKVAQPAGIVSANRGYRSIDRPMRCAGYRPCADDPDRRTGGERWPGLVEGNDNG